MKRNIKNIRGSELIRQLQHVDAMDAQAVTVGVLSPGSVVTTDISAAGVLVGKGALLRIQVGADVYLAFGASDIGVVSVSTSPAIKLPAGYHIIRATDDYIRASAAATRLEILSID